MSGRLLILMLPLLACAKSTTSTSSGAAPAAASENDAAGQQELGQLEDQWAKALETHDTAFFSRVAAADFHGTEDSAKTFSRADMMRNAADTTVRVRDVHDEDRQIRTYGNGTVGVVTGLSHWTAEGADRPTQYSGRYTEVWVKRDGRWQVVAGHYSLVPLSGAQP